LLLLLLGDSLLQNGRTRNQQHEDEEGRQDEPDGAYDHQRDRRPHNSTPGSGAPPTAGWALALIFIPRFLRFVPFLLVRLRSVLSKAPRRLFQQRSVRRRFSDRCGRREGCLTTRALNRSAE